MSYFGRREDDNSVRTWNSDMDVNDSKVYRGPGALDRAVKNEFGPKTGFLEAAGSLTKQVFENAEKRRTRDNLLRALNRPAQPFGGAGLAGRSFSLGDGSLTQINPDTFEPIVIPGGGAGVAGPSTGQRIAGAATGAISGFQAGAKTGIPHLAGIGALVGGIGSLF